VLAEALPNDGAREGPSGLGALVAEAFRTACRSEIGMVTGGSLRAGLPAGRLRRKELAAVLPFGNRVVCVEISGALLGAALEHGVAGLASGRGTLLHVSGMRYTADAAGAPGGRVVRSERMGAPLVAERTYTVALSSYILTGGDGFTFGGAVRGPQTVDVDALAASLEAADAPLRAPTDGLEMTLHPRP
jgi:2',3'-cyclic-nucleotide 2'-phosphodiesterase (5'-nucleotidase family)